jgi:hypothetical protein
MGGTVQNFDITAKTLKRGLTAETRRLSRRYFLSRTRYAVRELGASIARSIRGFSAGPLPLKLRSKLIIKTN